MKKTITMALALSLFGSAVMMAAPVDKARASQMALTYVGAQPDAAPGLSVKSIEPMYGSLYLVNFAPTGFAIVSGDDNAEPIVGYGVDQNITTTNMPENMAYMMQGAACGVSKLAATANVNKKWTSIENGTFVRSRDDNQIGPLIQVTWNQSSPYNKYCPGEGSNKAIVGCVAVAMSQAMSVQCQPAKPQGQVTYACVGYGKLSIDFDKEEPYDWNAILAGSNSYNETARLLYHAGMSVQMGYGADGSGIPSNEVYRITNALKSNFGYNNVSYHWRDHYTGDWTQMLLNELDAGRAIVYNAIDNVGHYGHSFNFDGYRGGLFHVNWGWGGSHDGFFSVDALTDGTMGMNYNSNHVAVIGIDANNSALHSVELSDLIVEEDAATSTPVAAILVNGALCNDSEFSVEMTGPFENSMYQKVPFTYSKGLIYPSRELSASADGEITLRVKVTSKADKVSFTQLFPVKVVAPQPLESRVSLAYDKLTKMFTIQCKFGSSYTVKNSQGAVVTQGTITDAPSFQVSRSQLTAGDNVVEITNGSKSKTFKISL